MTATMMQRVGTALVLADSQWNRETAKESWERVMARAAIEAMGEPTPAMNYVIASATKYGTESNSEVSPTRFMTELVRAALLPT